MLGFWIVICGFWCFSFVGICFVVFDEEEFEGRWCLFYIVRYCLGVNVGLYILYMCLMIKKSLLVWLYFR